MKKLTLTTIVLSVFLFTAFKPSLGKLVSNDTHIGFFSHTAVEDITANNYKVVSTLDTGTGDIVFSVPMQSFEFENALMQKHYNSAKFLNTKKFPKVKFTGKIADMESVDLSEEGSYQVTVSGDLTIKGETRPFHEKATIKVEAQKVTLDSKMKVVLADYGITFTDGKPSTNIAKEIEVTVKAVYQNE
jgi:polyisoprenoid-binding protein YceI